MFKKLILFVILLNFTFSIAQERQRARALGIAPGMLTPGNFNAITDVKGVAVGQKTLIVGDSVRSTHPDLRIPHNSNEKERKILDVPNDQMWPLFLVVVEASEEAIYNSLFMATDLTGQKGRVMKALPIDETLKIMDTYNARKK